MSNVDMDRPELLTAAREACRDPIDEGTWGLFEFWALMELGWNKALDAVDHPHPDKRTIERTDLDFWISRARHTLDTGHMPAPAR